MSDAPETTGMPPVDPAEGGPGAAVAGKTFPENPGAGDAAAAPAGGDAGIAAQTAVLQAEAAGAPPDPEDEGAEEEPEITGEEAAELRNIVEALIFASDEPISTKFIRQIIDDVNKDRVEDNRVRATTDGVKNAVASINRAYADRAFHITPIAGGFVFATKAKYSVFVGKLAKEKARRKLSATAIESLAIIAYKQPITKSEVEFIRGVNADYIIKTLLEKNLITITGRAGTPGRPLLYGTTDEFLKHFGLNEITDLPKPREIEELIGETELEVEKRMLAEQQELEFKDELALKLEGGHAQKASGARAPLRQIASRVPEPGEQTTPPAPAPEDAHHAEPAIEEAAIGETVTEEAAIGETVIGETVTEEAAIGEAVTEEAAIGEAVIGEAAIEEAVIEEAVTEEAAIGETVTEEAAIGEPLIPDEEPAGIDIVQSAHEIAERPDEEAAINEAILPAHAIEEPSIDDAVDAETGGGEPELDEAVITETLVDAPEDGAQASTEALIEESVGEKAATEEAAADEPVQAEVALEAPAAAEPRAEAIAIEEQPVETAADEAPQAQTMPAEDGMHRDTADAGTEPTPEKGWSKWKTKIKTFFKKLFE